MKYIVRLIILFLALLHGAGDIKDLTIKADKLAVSIYGLGNANLDIDVDVDVESTTTKRLR